MRGANESGGPDIEWESALAAGLEQFRRARSIKVDDAYRDYPYAGTQQVDGTKGGLPVQENGWAGRYEGHRRHNQKGVLDHDEFSNWRDSGDGGEQDFYTLVAWAFAAVCVLYISFELSSRFFS